MISQPLNFGVFDLGEVILDVCKLETLFSTFDSKENKSFPYKSIEENEERERGLVAIQVEGRRTRRRRTIPNFCLHLIS